MEGLRESGGRVNTHGYRNSTRRAMKAITKSGMGNYDDTPSISFRS